MFSAQSVQEWSRLLHKIQLNLDKFYPETDDMTVSGVFW